jgi:hypothetical protein
MTTGNYDWKPALTLETSLGGNRPYRQRRPTGSPTVEAAGSYSHDTDAAYENGYIVQRVDGQWSHSGGLSRAGSDRGGES